MAMSEGGDEKRNLKLKVLAMLGALLVVALCVAAIYSVQTLRETVTGLAAAFQPQSKFSTVLTGAIGRLNNNPKLVVLTADITATVIQEHATLFAGYTVGSATVEVSAPAKIQYYVPVNLLSKKDFSFDAELKILTVTVPRPVLDTDVVAIDSDPDKLSVRTQFGLSPLSVFKGPGARIAALRHLKEAAIHQGEHELLRDKADKNAKEIVVKQLQPVAELLNDGVKLEVEFQKPE